jgi:tryptophanyl-tRNA synthetase
MSGKRILTGMRPTGKLHLGHYAGALENWIRLQAQYECYFLIADYQALSDHIDEIDRIRNSVIDVALDWVAVGLDPVRNAFVIQSYVPEHAELTMYLAMLTPLGRLQRNPTLKVEMAQLSQDKQELSVGFFNYPVSQATDILLSKAHLVPVGDDQLPHIEMTKELARKFNRVYGEVFPVPEPLVGRVPRLVGIDGRAKMSKSLGNCIYLSDDAAALETSIRRMVTDSTGKNPRLRATDPGIVENNPAFLYHVPLTPAKTRWKTLKSVTAQAGSAQAGSATVRLRKSCSRRLLTSWSQSASDALTMKGAWTRLRKPSTRGQNAPAGLPRTPYGKCANP